MWFAFLSIALLLTACSSQPSAIIPPVLQIAPLQLPENLVIAANPQVTVTRTPFQAQQPTLPPTRTPTPVPTATATIVPTETAEPCLSQAGQMENHTVEFSSPALPLTFRVYLPPCYGKEDGYRYPVLYMIHGQTSGGSVGPVGAG